MVPGSIEVDVARPAAKGLPKYLNQQFVLRGEHLKLMIIDDRWLDTYCKSATSLGINSAGSTVLDLKNLFGQPEIVQYRVSVLLERFSSHIVLPGNRFRVNSLSHPRSATDQRGNLTCVFD